MELSLGLSLPALAMRGRPAGMVLPAYMSNFKLSNTNVLRSAYKNMLAGTSRCRLICVGDSNTAGPRQPDLTMQDTRDLSWPNVLAKKMAALGIPTTRSSVMCSQGIAIDEFAGEYHTEVSMGAGWIYGGAGTEGAAGFPFVNQSDDSTFDFTPRQAVNTFEIEYNRAAGATGHFAWSIDGGAFTTVSVDGATIGVLFITAGTPGAEALATPGTHTLRIRRATLGSTTAITVRNIVAYNTAIPALDVINAGRSGATTGDWQAITAPTSPRRIIPYMLPHGIGLMLGINNMRGNTAADAQFTTDMNASIDYYSLSGNVILMVPFPIATSGASNNFCSEENQETWRQAIRAIAATRDLPLIDFALKFGTWAAANAPGDAFDNLHPSNQGYAKMADDWALAIQYIAQLGAADVPHPSLAAMKARVTWPLRDTSYIIDKYIKKMDAAGAWAKVDIFYYPGADERELAKLNWKSASFDMTEIGSPTHTPRSGFQGNGVDQQLDTGYNPTTAPGAQFQQNSAHLFMRSMTNLEINSTTYSGDFGEELRAYLGRANGASGQCVARICSSTGVTAALTGAYPGYFGWSRNAAAVWEGYKGNVDSGGGTTASAALTNQTLRMLGTSDSKFGVNQIAIGHAGASLTQADLDAIYNGQVDFFRAAGTL